MNIWCCMIYSKLNGNYNFTNENKQIFPFHLPYDPCHSFFIDINLELTTNIKHSCFSFSLYRSVNAGFVNKLFLFAQLISSFVMTLQADIENKKSPVHQLWLLWHNTNFRWKISNIKLSMTSNKKTANYKHLPWIKLAWKVPNPLKLVFILRIKRLKIKLI